MGYQTPGGWFTIGPRLGPTAGEPATFSKLFPSMM